MYSINPSWTTNLLTANSLRKHHEQPFELMVPRLRKNKNEWAPVASSFMPPDKTTGAFSNLRSAEKQRSVGLQERIIEQIC